MEKAVTPRGHIPVFEQLGPPPIYFTTSTMFLLWVTVLEVALTVNRNAPAGVGPEGTLPLPPPQEIANTRIIKNTESPILLKRLRDTPRTRANTAAREYQSLKPGLCKEAAGRAVV